MHNSGPKNRRRKYTDRKNYLIGESHCPICGLTLTHLTDRNTRVFAYQKKTAAHKKGARKNDFVPTYIPCIYMHVYTHNAETII